MKLLVALFLTGFLGEAVIAQQQHQHHSPYASQEPSDIAALSPSDTRDLQDGAGMDLARRFAHDHIDQSTLKDLVGEIAELRGQLRYVHLSAHLKAKELLTAHQVERYEALRGYVGSRDSGQG